MIMTPKEKALDIIHKMEDTPHYFWDKNQTDAMVAVEEIINQWEYIDTYLADMRGELNPNLRYW